ncbi:MAG TPA: DUF3305 domain-containing protein, partial [Burkholderiales bacterium]|nr:DUF3305 domain-containing protein [Burkholderiales bacterium]
VMQRREIQHRWQSDVWEPVEAISGAGEGSARVIAESGQSTRWLYPDLALVLRVADADGYFLNVTTSEPSVFVMWRMEAERAVPCLVTASYSEASSWMEGGENVDRVPMPPDILSWVRDFVARHYRPQPKKKIRPQSFKHPKDRARR